MMRGKIPYTVQKFCEEDAGKTKRFLSLEPLKSQIVIFDQKEHGGSVETGEMSVIASGEPIKLGTVWKRSICRSIDYPNWREKRNLPDLLHEEEPLFSGFVRYENQFEGKAGETYVLKSAMRMKVWKYL